MNPTIGVGRRPTTERANDSAFRPSTHAEMYWQNRNYDLDVYRYSLSPEVFGVAVRTEENA